MADLKAGAMVAMLADVMVEVLVESMVGAKAYVLVAELVIR